MFFRETKLEGGIMALSQTTFSMFVVSNRGIIYNIKHQDPLHKVEYFSSSHSSPIRNINFPRYSFGFIKI